VSEPRRIINRNDKGFGRVVAAEYFDDEEPAR